MQTSAMLGVLGVAIFIGQLLMTWLTSRLFLVIYWSGVLVLVLWMALLALADMAATSFYYSREKNNYVVEHARLQGELRQARTGSPETASRRVGEPRARQSRRRRERRDGARASQTVIRVSFAHRRSRLRSGSGGPSSVRPNCVRQRPRTGRPVGAKASASAVGTADVIGIAKLLFDLGVATGKPRPLHGKLDLGLAELVAALVLQLLQPLPLLADDRVLVEHLLQGRGAQGQRAEAVALVVEQVLEFFDLAVLFGDDLVGAGHDLFDLQPPFRRFGVVLIVGLQFRQEPAFLGFPIAAAVRRRRRGARRGRPGLDLQQLPLKLGVAGLQVADVVHRHQITAGSILGQPAARIAFRRPRQEFRPQAFVGRLQGMDLGLQGLDLAGEVGRDLPPAIALGLKELPHAGVLGLQGAGEIGRSRRRSARERRVRHCRQCGLSGTTAGVAGWLAAHRQGRPQASARKASQVNVSIEMNEG